MKYRTETDMTAVHQYIWYIKYEYARFEFVRLNGRYEIRRAAYTYASSDASYHSGLHEGEGGVSTTQASSPTNCTACARKRAYKRLNALQQRPLPDASDDCHAVDTRVANQGKTCCVHTYLTKF